jgi:hypothetical protein
MPVQTLDVRSTMALGPVRDTQIRSGTDQCNAGAAANRLGAGLWPLAPGAPVRHASRQDELRHKVGLLALQHVASLMANSWG